MGHSEIKGMQESLGISPEKEWGFGKDSFFFLYEFPNTEMIRM